MTYPGRRRRGQGGGARVASDWRWNVRGIQASFRRGASDEYVTLGGGAIQAITDNIPTAVKTVAQAPYVVSAPSAGQRPTLGASQRMSFAAASSQMLREAASPLAVLLRGGACTVIAYGALNDVVNDYDLVSVTTKAINSAFCHIYHENAGTDFRWVTNTPSAITQCGAADANRHMVAGTWDAAVPEIEAFLDAAAGTNAALANMPNSMDEFALGALDRAVVTNFLDGYLLEVLVCLVPLTAAEQAAVLANLAGDYP